MKKKIERKILILANPIYSWERYRKNSRKIDFKFWVRFLGLPRRRSACSRSNRLKVDSCLEAVFHGEHEYAKEIDQKLIFDGDIVIQSFGDPQNHHLQGHSSSSRASGLKVDPNNERGHLPLCRPSLE